MTGVLDFLSPSLAVAERAFRPVARSAAEPLYRTAGATFEEGDGWRIATSVTGETEALDAVGIADLSYLAKLEVRPAPQSLTGDGVTTYRLSPQRGLVLFPERSRAGVLGQMDTADLVLDVTAAYTVLAISGPEARTLIARLTHLHDFPCGGEVAHVTAHVLPAGGGFRIVLAQEFGHYLGEVALDCARALGGGLIGVDALPEDERP